MPNLLTIGIEQRHDDVRPLQDRSYEVNSFSLMIRSVRVELHWRLLWFRHRHDVTEVILRGLLELDFWRFLFEQRPHVILFHDLNDGLKVVALPAMKLNQAVFLVDPEPG